MDSDGRTSRPIPPALPLRKHAQSVWLGFSQRQDPRAVREPGECCAPRIKRLGGSAHQSVRQKGTPLHDATFARMVEWQTESGWWWEYRRRGSPLWRTCLLTDSTVVFTCGEVSSTGGAVSGWTHPWDEDQAEARRLLDLRYHLSALAATEYCRAGFATVVQGNIFGEDVRTWLQAVPVRPRHLVVLRPSIAVVLERDRVRQRELGEVAYRSGETDPHELDTLLATTPRFGLWLDTSTQTPNETVQSILGQRSKAVVDSIV